MRVRCSDCQLYAARFSDDRGKVSEQAKPSIGNSDFMAPESALVHTEISWLPKPRLFTAVTFGPPTSLQYSVMLPSRCRQPTSTRPVPFDRAPCLAAFVTSSLIKRIRLRAVSGSINTSSPSGTIRSAPYGSNACRSRPLKVSNCGFSPVSRSLAYMTDRMRPKILFAFSGSADSVLETIASMTVKMFLFRCCNSLVSNSLVRFLSFNRRSTIRQQCAK